MHKQRAPLWEHDQALMFERFQALVFERFKRVFIAPAEACSEAMVGSADWHPAVGPVYTCAGITKSPARSPCWLATVHQL